MPNANIIELETGLDDCLNFCLQHPENEYATRYLERFTQAKHRWYKSVELSEAHHVRWRTEEREEAVAKKQLALTLREVQGYLRRINAIGYPKTRVLYWDEERLLAMVGRVKTYLQEHSAQIPSATEYIDKLERGAETIQQENREVGDALKGFQRFVDLRREAMNDLGALLGEFRVALRRSLGKKHPLYTGIRWPYGIASDEGVLF